jgi:surface antigen
MPLQQLRRRRGRPGIPTLALLLTLVLTTSACATGYGYELGPNAPLGAATGAAGGGLLAAAAGGEAEAITAGVLLGGLLGGAVGGALDRADREARLRERRQSECATCGSGSGGCERDRGY